MVPGVPVYEVRVRTLNSTFTFSNFIVFYGIVLNLWEMLYAGYPCSLICRVGRGVGISGFPSRVGKTGSSPQKLDVPYCRTVFAWLRLGPWGWSWAGLDE